MAVSLEASLGTNVPMCLVLFCAFALLRPRVPAIYAPRVRLQTLQQRPPELGDGFWDWLGPLLALDERAVLASAGLDVVMYLRFVRLSSQLFAVATVLGWVFLGEALGPAQVAGMLVVLVGVALVTMPSRLA